MANNDYFSEEEYDENFGERDDDNNEDSEDVPDEGQNFLNKNEVLYTMELDHLDNRLHKETNVAILKEAVKIAQDSFLWRFRTLTKRTSIVLQIYYHLTDHINVDK